MVVKSKFFGRFLMVISAMNVNPRENVRFTACTSFEKNRNYTFKKTLNTPLPVSFNTKSKPIC
jgi:hypothetical protein